MKGKMKQRFLTFAIIVAMVLSVLPYAPSVNAATYPSYNTGHRDTVARSLSDDAVSYYQTYYDGAFSYEANFGGLEKSALKEELEQLMTTTMTNSVSYSSLTNYWPYTDAEDGQAGTVLFYTDEDGTGFNREHVWPKSRASFYQSKGGSDLHHLRPTNTQVNSTRSNYTMGNVKGYVDNYSTVTNGGKEVGWYISDGNGLFEPLDNVKGDVARIYLYVYVRWDERNLFTQDASKQESGDSGGNDGKPVIESLNTLLQWMAEDPVDTWEMSRNDLTEAIQGNRNVFIDYPELAWDIFGVDAPEGYATPSNATGGAITPPPVTEPDPDPNPNPDEGTGSGVSDTSKGTFTTITDTTTLKTGDYIQLYDSKNDNTLSGSATNNWLNCKKGNIESADMLWNVVTDGTNLYLKNSDGAYLYSSTAKKIETSTESKTAIAYSSTDGSVKLNDNLLCYNTGNSAYRPYKSAGSTTPAASIVIKKYTAAATEDKPSGETTPSEGDKPSGGTTPSEGDKPSGETTPSEGDKPSGETTPSEGDKPSGGTTPSEGNQPSGGTTPSGGGAPSGGSVSTGGNTTPKDNTEEENTEADKDKETPSEEVQNGHVNGTIKRGKLFDENGDVVKNKVVVTKDNHRYYAGKNGVPAKNKLVKDEDGNAYYATKNGKLAVSSIVKDKNGNKYYASSTGVILKSSIITLPDGTKYYATKSGKLAKSKWIKIDGVKYYCNKNGKIIKTKTK